MSADIKQTSAQQAPFDTADTNLVPNGANGTNLRPKPCLVRQVLADVFAVGLRARFSDPPLINPQ